ncbi:ABC-2 type transport system ATP-binding protein [Actinopolymorpha cephalotaxi]|uniref:ABC-2 type transport system ATP-binding protein n=1 Tax=Actinopolymorpha cephalotaxi TaxID=504797 RepID=A0A1I3A6E8_9ACTN|nr:ATP-binding cassette domain-containing protein [Actinopolymorpha cephalotaxi]NYH85314.1 ABC-2 type transport system ATP-binding protein [Actinopolymorpha cephalotaxi]SFH45654.1 ABC-2 type transport system ATP-binding protein [Actinopolymorpha cephalotaxi]
MIRAAGLVKRYKNVEALAGLDLTVPEGRVLALLGPNGAGKTTAVRILATLLDADEGTAEVAGVDVRKDPDGVRSRIGLSGQYAAVDEYLTGYENLEMVGRLYGLGKAKSGRRARELLEQFDLADAGDRPSKTYSGGMRRRLDLAGALVAEPPVLILDEPTTGLDVRARQQMWDVIRSLVDAGSTLLLTTQYLEEADRLAHDILVIDHGRAIAHGSADELKAQVGGERIELMLADASDRSRACEALAAVAVGEVQIDDNGRALTVAVAGGAPALRRVLEDLESANVGILDVGLRRPTLDDVFLSLTGHAAEEEAAESASSTGSDGPDRSKQPREVAR